MALTQKQEKFCQCAADGMIQSDAYRAAFGQGKMSDKTINEQASKLMALPKIYTRVAELKEQLANKALWTREESVNKLKEALDIADRPTDIVSVIKELNAMHGYNAPTKHEVEHKGAVNIFVPEQDDDV